MKGRFCYRCGALERDRGPLIQGLCLECLSQENPLLHAPSRVKVKLCKSCGAYFLGGWKAPLGSVEEAVGEVIKSMIKVVRITPAGKRLLAPAKAGARVKLHPHLNRKRPVVEVLAEGRVHEQARPQLERSEVEVELDWGTCNACDMRRSGYYEAVVQVRGKVSIPELKKLLKNLELKAQSRDRTSFISKIDETNGLDIYVSRLSLGRKIASALKSSYGARISESAKLVGTDREGIRKYRVSILARLPQENPF